MEKSKVDEFLKAAEKAKENVALQSTNSSCVYFNFADGPVRYELTENTVEFCEHELNDYYNFIFYDHIVDLIKL